MKLARGLSIENLNLSNRNVTGFDFSDFTSLKTLELRAAKGLTTTLFNDILRQDKASIKIIYLTGVNVIAFDFSGFTVSIIT